MQSVIQTEIVGGLGVITLNRPKALNALSLEMVRELTVVLRGWATHPAVHAVLLRGAARPAEGGKPVFEHRRFCAIGRLAAEALRWSK